MYIHAVRLFFLLPAISPIPLSVLVVPHKDGRAQAYQPSPLRPQFPPFISNEKEMNHNGKKTILFTVLFHLNSILH